ncbi:efflux RND transporter periplasmic adaptor subunit [Stutzerimonas urumqiensis]|uniref:efflux RND transporter periplasmic adaptor subunit n=1 Tax=Stutzerimonas urumqiensis TaxID=638269 RepID=UPI003BAB757E
MLRRRMLIMLGAVIVVVLILAAFKYNAISRQIAQFQAPKPAVAVEAVEARLQTWQTQLRSIGTLRAVQGIDLTTEVAGTVSAVSFRSGQKVEKNQPLIVLDAAVEQANLATAEAELGLARAEYERGRSLLARQALSRSEFDRLEASLQKASASVEQLKASLAKKRILAPFSGTIGLRQVDLGDYLSAGTPIATLQDLSTLQVDFSLPEQQVPQVAVGQPVRLELAAYPGETFEGAITAINPKVDISTRNVQVRAELGNPDGRLLPGMFADLRVLLPIEAPRVVVPETAVSYSLYGDAVFVVVDKPADGSQADADADADADAEQAAASDDLVLERRFVETGDRRDGLVVLTEGIEPGERVVVSGQLKLDNGTPVTLAETRTLDPRTPDTAE